MTSLLLLALAAAPLEDARAHLKAGRLDEVLFALEGKSWSEAEKPQAAQLLGEAAGESLAKHDELLGLQFAQMALKLDPGQAGALEVAARSSLKEQQFATAEEYADRWLTVEPKSPSARLLRAELAFEAGEWSLVLRQLDQAKPLKGEKAGVAAVLRAKAAQELAQRKEALTSVATLERRVAMAAAKAKSKDSAGFARPISAASSGGVTVYTTAWCGYCKKMKAFLKKKGVDFVEKDIERDPEAEKELAQKAAAAGVNPRGVPVTDVRGKLILGFDTEGVEAAL
jgi:glutaredoxin